MPGPLLRSRITHAIYRQLGIDTLTAADADDYVRKAINVAQDHRWRSELSRSILQSVEAMYDNPVAIDEWNQTLLGLAEQSRRN